MTKEQLQHIFENHDKNGIRVEGTELYLSWDNSKIHRVAEKYGDNHSIKVISNCPVNLEELPDNQSVVGGDGIGCYFLLTDIEN